MGTVMRQFFEQDSGFRSQIPTKLIEDWMG